MSARHLTEELVDVALRDGRYLNVSDAVVLLGELDRSLLRDGSLVESVKGPAVTAGTESAYGGAHRRKVYLVRIFQLLKRGGVFPKIGLRS